MKGSWKISIFIIVLEKRFLCCNFTHQFTTFLLLPGETRWAWLMAI